MSEAYDIVFHGELAPGVSREEVKRRLVTLFGSEEKIDALFAGGSVLVKRNVIATNARRYEQAFLQAGAVCKLVPTTASAAAGAPPLPPTTATRGTLVYGSPSSNSVALAPTERPPGAIPNVGALAGAAPAQAPPGVPPAPHPSPADAPAAPASANATPGAPPSALAAIPDLELLEPRRRPAPPVARVPTEATVKPEGPSLAHALEPSHFASGAAGELTLELAGGLELDGPIAAEPPLGDERPAPHETGLDLSLPRLVRQPSGAIIAIATTNTGQSAATTPGEQSDASPQRRRT